MIALLEVSNLQCCNLYINWLVTLNFFCKQRGKNKLTNNLYPRYFAQPREYYKSNARTYFVQKSFWLWQSCH